MFNLHPGKRVSWADGMLVLPQHFQQQETFLLNNNLDWIRKLNQIYYGLTSITIDDAALERGYFGIVQSSGVFPDGTHFEIPGRSATPKLLPLKSDAENALIVLAITVESSTNKSVRYEVEEVNSLEEVGNAISEVKTIQVSALSVRLCQINDLADYEVAIPVAKIWKISEEGGIEIDESFIPPLLNLRSNKWLWKKLIDLLDLTRHRANWQIERLNQPQTSSLVETMDFLSLQTLLRYEAELSLLLAQEPVLPLFTYQCLLGMATSLMALKHPPMRFSKDNLWTPTNASHAFKEVLEKLNEILSQIRERLALEIEFKQDNDNTFLSAQSLPDMEDKDRMIIAVHAEVPNDWFWDRFASQVTICPLDRLAERIKLQMPGVAIKHLSTTPPELPLQSGWHYFELNQVGEMWEEIKRAKGAGFYISGHWHEIKLRAWVIKNGSLRGEVA
jgi:type VI secretion system protein ImpJ